MIVHSYYDEDPRVRREAEALVAAGREVDVLALRREEDPADNSVAGVRVHRLNVQRHQGAGIVVYLREYLSFLVRSGWALVRAHRRRRYGLVQVHSLPDFLVFAALPLRLVGVPLVLDLHEAMPEFFRMRFPGASNPLAHWLLLLQERLSIALAAAVVTVNRATADRLVELGVRPEKITVVVNTPSLARFDAAAARPRPFAADGVVRF
ncbi:MAG TPA: glycosyltransferase, partial [Candidatus Limnocylindrales bacterium]|nr:glycosyltransferase [Candidatus Limnocylindrales bacterium]